MKKLSKTQLVAPCGMDCALCLAYQRDKKSCPGCRVESKNKASSCITCVIKNCPTLKKKNLRFCSDKCEHFPCQRLRNLNKRYQEKYRMSMLENLDKIQTLGIRKFVEQQKKQWTCPECKKLLCVHRNFCLHCQK